MANFNKIWKGRV